MPARRSADHDGAAQAPLTARDQHRLVAAWNAGGLGALAGSDSAVGGVARHLLQVEETLAAVLSPDPRRLIARNAALIAGATAPDLRAIHLYDACRLTGRMGRHEDSAHYAALLRAEALSDQVRPLQLTASIWVPLHRWHGGAGDGERESCVPLVARAGRLVARDPGVAATDLALCCLDYANALEDDDLVDRWLQVARERIEGTPGGDPRWIRLQLARMYAARCRGHAEEVLAIGEACAQACGGGERTPDTLRPMQVEAMVGLGRIDEAERLLRARTGMRRDADWNTDDLSGIWVPLLTRIAIERREYARAHALIADGLLGGQHADPRERQRKSYPRLEQLLPKLDLELIERRSVAARQTLDYLARLGVFRFRGLEGRWIRLDLQEGRFAAAVQRMRRIRQRGDPRRMRRLFEGAHELSAMDLVALLAAAGTDEDVPPRSRTSAPAPPQGSADLVGESTGIRAAAALIRRYAMLDAAVLVQGETGTGKEIVARSLHEQGPRRDEPFVAINCGALSDNLIESELFGHVTGAFTGAARDHDGLLVAAGRGTVFLDEITSMPQRLQAVLLRVLETGEVRPVGGTRSRQLRARVVAASNRPLLAEVARGAFREDLYYRLARLLIDLPPLRERGDDVPLLAQHFLDGLRAEPPYRITERMQAWLRAQPWPGNVRELRNVIERLALVSGDGTWIDVPPEGAPARPPGPSAPPAAIDGPPGPGYRAQRLQALRRAIAASGWMSGPEAVRLLGCSPKTATADLRRLEALGVVRAVMPPGGTRPTHYESSLAPLTPARAAPTA